MIEPLINISETARRRTIIFDNGIATPHHTISGVSPLQELVPEKPPQAIEDRVSEVQRIVKRLLAVIGEHRAAALRMNFFFNAEMLDVVIRALEAETCGEDPSAILADNDEVCAYLLSALYEELLDEPSNIFFTTQVGTNVVRYEAMEVAFWKECVAALRRKLML